MSRYDDPDLVHECKQFRICIIGKAGVGKSTLLAKVFGFSDATVLLPSPALRVPLLTNCDGEA